MSLSFNLIDQLRYLTLQTTIAILDAIKVMDIHRISASGYLNNGGIVKVLTEAINIDGCRCDNNFEIGAFRQ